VICKRLRHCGFGRQRTHHRPFEGSGHEGQMSREVGADIYQMTKFKRSNQNTCINQKPIVYEGQRVKKGAVSADGPCTEAASWRSDATCWWLHAWRGYNFETRSCSAKSWSRTTITLRFTLKSSSRRSRHQASDPRKSTRDIPNIAEAFLRISTKADHPHRRDL